MKMTQTEVNEAFEKTKAEWAKMEKESGLSHEVFILTKPAIQFLGRFELIRMQVIADNLIVDKLEDKVEIKFYD